MFASPHGRAAHSFFDRRRREPDIFTSRRVKIVPFVLAQSCAVVRFSRTGWLPRTCPFTSRHPSSPLPPLETSFLPFRSQMASYMILSALSAKGPLSPEVTGAALTALVCKPCQGGLEASLLCALAVVQVLRMNVSMCVLIFWLFRQSIRVRVASFCLQQLRALCECVERPAVHCSHAEIVDAAKA